jgi:nicotinamide-nucleotide amidase
MNAHVLTIGDELLIGQTLNTNATWIGEQLDHAGIDVVAMSTVGDDKGVIQSALQMALRDADLIVITGGLGPTHDDITKIAIADFFLIDLEFRKDLYDRVAEMFARRGRIMPESNRSQAEVPTGAEALENRVGTAPGIWLEREVLGRPRIIVLLPGVPYEMKVLMQEHVLPRLSVNRGVRAIYHRTLQTTGIAESSLAEKLWGIEPFISDGLRLAFLPSPSGVRLRLTGAGQDRDQVDEKLDRFEAFVREQAGDYVFGVGDETIEAVVGHMLLEKGLTLALGESCTGGAVLDRLTNIPGSSSYVKGGVTAYSNEVKMKVLGVQAESLKNHGAVSERVAIEMAIGVRRLVDADIGMSTTGIAGPTGGTADKPVGTVWIGYADDRREFAVSMRFGTDRVQNKERSSAALLDVLRRELKR